MGKWFDVLPMTQVDHRLFVGGTAPAAELAKQNPAKISAVLCVHQTMDYEKNSNIIYMHVPFEDGEPIPPRQFINALGWLKFMYENGHVILIHCAAGISRSVTILAAFMHYEGISDFNTALDSIRMNRPSIGPSPAVLVSAKKLLGVFPYDGSLLKTPGHEVIERVQNQRTAYAHPDPNCPMRIFLLSQQENNTPRHEIDCTCALSGVTSLK